ncbi:hypothetical protein [Spirosoma validum]|uniref:Uncharacterized protein n=1 Tax=Spirosoma validum TaxID=2771355 RepID=A0A927B8U3_9BACT|nr:hypothetical protein [Spirosoma validum]MBD2757307.1 hypothetical protein [Spirosoma validum]
MKNILLISVLFISWTVRAQVQTSGKITTVDSPTGVSIRNRTIQDSIAEEGVIRYLKFEKGSGRQAAALTPSSSLSTTCFSGNYADLTNKPVLFSGNYIDLANKPVLFSGNYADLANKPVLFSGSYADLCCKPTTLTAFANDADYQTGTQVRATIRSATDTLNTRIVATTTAINSVSATAAQALALAQNNQGSTGGQTVTYMLQYRATNVSTSAGTGQTISHNFGANTGIDRIVAYEVNTRVSVDMPFDTNSVTDTGVTIQPLVSTTYTAIIVIGHKLQ